MKLRKNNKEMLEAFEGAAENCRVAVMIGLAAYAEFPDGFSGEFLITVDQALNREDLIQFLKAALAMAEDSRIAETCKDVN